MHDLLSTHYAPYLLGCFSSEQDIWLYIKHREHHTTCEAKRNLPPKAQNNTLAHRILASNSLRGPSTSSPSPVSSSMTLFDVTSDCSSASLKDGSLRVRLPFPFPQENVVNTVEFGFSGSPGVCLDTWIKLSEKRQTHRCLDSPEDSLEELILDRTILYQCQWPGYDPHTCFVPVPTHTEDGADVLKKGDLLDMICEVLACWILRVMRCGHVKCTEPEWAIGVNNITFKHVYIVAVVEVQGYVPKWVPVLEVDSNIFGQ